MFNVDGSFKDGKDLIASTTHNDRGIVLVVATTPQDWWCGRIRASIFCVN